MYLWWLRRQAQLLAAVPAQAHLLPVFHQILMSVEVSGSKPEKVSMRIGI